MGHLVTLILVFVFSMGATAEMLEAYPRSNVVESSSDDETRVHRIVTGEVKRFNGEIRPESADFVSGKKSTTTYEILETDRPETVAQFYRDALVATGQILFECVGRRCGDSNYWANTVFNRSILYGPIDDQRYLFASLEGNRGAYALVYVARRATGKQYVHVELISEVGSERVIDRRLIASALRLQKRFVIDAPSDETLLSAIREVINDASSSELAIVAHNSVDANETVDAARLRSLERAKSVVAQLRDMGADTRNLSAFGAGPISPVSRTNKQRIELVLIR